MKIGMKLYENYMKLYEKRMGLYENWYEII